MAARSVYKQSSRRDLNPGSRIISRGAESHAHVLCALCVALSAQAHWREGTPPHRAGTCVREGEGGGREELGIKAEASPGPAGVLPWLHPAAGCLGALSRGLGLVCEGDLRWLARHVSSGPDPMSSLVHVEAPESV